MVLNKKLIIIAGPCAIDQNNIEEVFKISEISVINKFNKRQKAIFGARVVGLKSRTMQSNIGKDLGIDYKVFMENVDKVKSGESINNLKMPPSIEMAVSVVKNTNMLVATEIMDPIVQLPLFEGKIPKDKLLVWNPSVNQLGWHVMELASFAKRNGWYIGLKNGKWLGEKDTDLTTMEKAWIGIANYTRLINFDSKNKLVLIHRGVDVQGKGDFRNMLVHQAAKKVKLATKTRLFLDPSHSFGPKLRNKILSGVIEAMKMKMDDQNFLYDGILIEVGHAKTDNDQHISVDELQEMCNELSKFRELTPPSVE